VFTAQRGAALGGGSRVFGEQPGDGVGAEGVSVPSGRNGAPVPIQMEHPFRR
jgi:hypothetical protein